MNIKIYQVDAFTNKLFGGNPAAVCPLLEWLSPEIMQSIAEENNLSETAFYVQKGQQFHIRWFTPKIEIELAGHPTLATAHVIFNETDYAKKTIEFHSASGVLIVSKCDDLLWMDFPASTFDKVEAPDELTAGLGKNPMEVYKGRDYMALYESENDIISLEPDFNILEKVDCLGIIATAIGKKCDFVSRFFAPLAGINEDPVTGSAHTMLIPFWAARLNKKQLHAFQVSKRRGELFCEDRRHRVGIGGRAITFLRGSIDI
jgi:PhzF family phenazine biosynthesis protein